MGCLEFQRWRLRMMVPKQLGEVQLLIPDTMANAPLLPTELIETWCGDGRGRPYIRSPTERRLHYRASRSYIRQPGCTWIWES